MNEVETRARRLVESLKQRREDRGFMADLRRGFNADTEHRAWPHVAPWCDLTNDRQRAIHTTVMAGFASHPEHAEDGNLGVTLRRIAIGDGGESGLQSFEARFRRLLTCDTAEEAARQAGYVIRAAAAKGVPVDYVALFKDLTYWGGPDNRVKLRWARGYWSGVRPDEADIEAQVVEEG